MNKLPNYLSMLVTAMLLIPIHLTAISPDLAAITNASSTQEWHTFTLPGIDPATIFTTHAKAYELGPDDAMVLTKNKTDRIGYTHYTFEQFYKNIPVEDARFKVHARGGQAISAGGRIISSLNLSVSPFITPTQAVSAALNHINATTYLWQIAHEEMLLKASTNDSSATWYPSARLVIVRSVDNLPMAASNYVLAWKVDVFSADPFDYQSIYIDAQTGIVLKTRSLVSCSHCDVNDKTCHNAATGGACTVNYGMQGIETDEEQGHYRLFDCTRGNGIHTVFEKYDPQAQPPPNDICHSSNYWLAPDVNCYLTEAHWCAEMTYDYFLNDLGRNSFDDLGKRIDIRVSELPVFACNAQNTGSTIRIGKINNSSWCQNIIGMASDFYISLDMMGHEFTHGLIIEDIGSFIATDEGPAITEGYCDIFGTMVEFYAHGQTAATIPDYVLFEDIMAPGSASLRDMCDPTIYGGQATWMDTNWPSTDPHDNGGVVNKWFCLFANGGSGANGIGTAYNVGGIGRDPAAKIAYRALVHELNPADGFEAMRYATSKAAFDLYGGCSYEFEQNLLAWDAVNVTAPLLTTASFSSLDVMVTQNETWTTSQVFSSNVIVKAPAVLTISNTTLKFGPDLGITVEAGASLVVDNSMMTTSCRDEMWQGIVVESEDGIAPAPPVRGEVIMSGSTIQHAHMGISNKTDLTGTGHGRLNLEGNTFRNNGKHLLLWQSAKTQAYLSENTFTCDGKLKDEARYNSRGTQIYVELNQSKGAFFHGNTFQNTGPFEPWKLGTGILSYNSAFRVSSCTSYPACPSPPDNAPNKFNRLYKGIDAYGMGSLTHTMEVRYNQFNKTYLGITANGTAYDRISGNQFDLPDALLTYLALPAVYGVYMYGSNGYIVQENTFSGSGGNPVLPNNVYGVVARNVGTTGGEVYHNTFTDMPRVATQSEQQNDALQIKCNLYANNNYDWRVTSGVLADQGECLPGDFDGLLPAGNEFSVSITGGQRQIYSPVASFIYSHHSEQNGGPNVRPDYFTKVLITPDDCNVPKVEGSCPDLNLNGVDEGDTKNNLKKVHSTISRQLLVNRLMRLLITEDRLHEAEVLLESEKSRSAYQTLAAFYLDQQNIAALSKCVKHIPSNTEENRNFRKLYDALSDLTFQSDGFQAISSSEQTLFQDVANSPTRVSVQAETVLAMVEATQYLRVPEDLNDPINKWDGMREDNSDYLFEDGWLTALPNPAATSVSISWQIGVGEGTLSIYNYTGIEVASIALLSKQGQHNLNVSMWKPGVYFVVIREKNGAMFSGKLLIMR